MDPYGYTMLLRVVVSGLTFLAAGGGSLRPSMEGGADYLQQPTGDRKEPAPPERGRKTDRPRPRSDERNEDRLRMIQTQIENRGVRDPAVLEAIRQVPRQWFVPAAMQASAYEDRPLPIGEGQTISQPYIVAFMTEALKLTPDSKVLEVGTGSGYQAAVLAEITPHIFTIEIVEPLARRAMATFKEHGYETINTRIGDGYAGWPEQAPFDAIIVTCAPGHVPPKLVEQLKPGGRLCIPVGPEGQVQKLMRMTKQPDGTTSSEDLLPVSFVPMTGEAKQNP